MSRGPATFKQRDIAAAIRAARQAGIEVARIKIEKDGTITIIFGTPAAELLPANEWDEVLESEGER